MRSTPFNLVVATIVLAGCANQPARQTSAIVVDIAAGPSPRWDTDKVRITARTPDGIIGTRNVLKAELNCHVGDVVKASVRGIALKLDDRACTG